MGRKKGDKTTSDNLINLKDRTKEERKKISQMGVEARKRKKEQAMALQNCMKDLLTMEVSNESQKKILKQLGFSNDELQNKTILMVALFKKALTGDVGAISKIVEMMDKLDLYDSGKTVDTSVVINLVPQGQSYTLTEKDEEEILKADSDDEEWMQEDDDWGTEVYLGD